MEKEKDIKIESIYCREIQKIPILSKEKVYELGVRNKNGDLEARKELFIGHLRLVASIARRFVKGVTYLSYMDLVQAGNLGLLSSLENYDPDKGTLTTYASNRIISQIKYEILKHENTISLPIYLQRAKDKYNNFSDMDKTSSDDELTEMLSCYRISKNNLEYIRNDKEIEFVNIESLEEDCDCYSYNPQYDERIAKAINNYELFIALKELLKPMQYFVLYHFVLTDSGFKYTEAGKLFGISHQAIQQSEQKVLNITKDLMDKKDEALVKIRKIEKDLYYKLKTEPIHPNDIIKYLYLKDSFDEVERSILYELLLGKYNLNEEEYARYFNMSLNEYLNKSNLIKKRIDSILQDEEKYNCFVNTMRSTFKTDIYNLDLNTKYNFNSSEVKTLSKKISN
ncbi:MAG: sigma-70 family RNA polymerase sigma factor [Bacilli bacterium]